MDETQFISVEDQAIQDSSDADDLGKGITNLGKAIRDCKKSSDNQFAFMKEQVAAILAVLSKKTVYTAKIPPSGFSGSIPHPLVKRYEHHPLKLSEVDLPTFKGENPEAWLRNCESYFQFHFIKYEEWVNLAESHLDDRARIWYTSWKLDKRFITWTIFCNELCRWFDSQHCNDVVDEASKVEQLQDSVETFGACKVIDKMPSQVSPVTSESPSIAMEDSCPIGLENNQVDDVMIADEESSGIVDDEMSSLEEGASISAKETRVLFDDSTESIRDQVLGNVGYISQAGTFDQVLGSSGDETVKFLNKSTGIQLIEKVESSILAKQEDLEISGKIFDVMLRPFLVKPKGGNNRDVDPISLTDGVPRVFDPGISVGLCIRYELFQPSIILITDSKSVSCQCHSSASFLGQCKSVLSLTSTNMVFTFDPGGSEELFGFLFGRVVGMLYYHLLECLVRCLWSYTISLVDERKRAIMALKNDVVGSSVKSSKLLTELLIDCIFWTRGALNLDDAELVQMNFGTVPIMIQPGVGLKIVIDVGLHFQRPDDEAEFGQTALVVLNPSSMIEMCLVHFMPNLFYVSNSVMEIKKKKVTANKVQRPSRLKRVSKGDIMFEILDKMCLFTSLRTRMFLRVWERVYVVWKTWKRKSIEDCCKRCEAMKNCSHELQLGYANEIQ